MCASHEPSRIDFRPSQLRRDIAPIINSLRISACPALEIRPSRSLPPDENWRGTRPSHAEKSRPHRKFCIGGANASTASAVNGPTPGMVCKAPRCVSFSRQRLDLVRPGIDAIPPTAAEAPAPRSETSSDASIKEAAVEVVRNLIERDGGDASSSLRAVASIYADSISYYGKQKSIAEVLADKRDYFMRWPERAYRIRDGSLMVTCTNGACMVSGIYDWVVRSIPRNKQAQGAARFSYTISHGANP